MHRGAPSIKRTAVVKNALNRIATLRRKFTSAFHVGNPFQKSASEFHIENPRRKSMSEIHVKNPHWKFAAATPTQHGRQMAAVPGSVTTSWAAACTQPTTLHATHWYMPASAATSPSTRNSPPSADSWK